MVAPQPMFRAGFVTLAFLSAFTVLRPAAFAQDADELIKQGVELRRAGQDQTALERFRRAYELSATPRALAQIGLAEQALGRWADAEAHLLTALEAARDPWITKYRTTLEASRVTVGQHLGSLEVVGQPAEAEVRVAGRFVGKLPLVRALRLTAGSVLLEVSAAGHVPSSRTVSVFPGQLTRESVALQAVTSSPGLPAHPANDSARGRGSETEPEPEAPPALASGGGHGKLAWISLGTALGLAAVGTTAVLVHDAEARDYNQNRCPSMPTLPACQDRRTAGTLSLGVGVASFVLAGALGLTAAVLFVRAPARAPARAHDAPVPEKTLGLVCVPQPWATGVSCAVRF